jgi:hypothetical protein
MTHALDTVGPFLFSLPDGEIGEITEMFPKGKRSAWVLAQINQCAADKENFKIVRESVRNKEGFPKDYKHVDRIKPLRPPAELDKHLDLGYYTYFKSSYPVFKKLREEKGRADLKFQVGVPTGLGITFTMMSPVDAFRYANAFNRRIAYEASQIIAEAGDEVIFQVEIPAELALAYRLPGLGNTIGVRQVMSLVKLLPATAKVGIHLCLGDLNNEALTRAKTLNTMVTFSNKLIAAWPQANPPLYCHYPLAEAADPPHLEAAYYAPLQNIKLPPDTDFVAGFVHEKLNADQGRQILKAIEDVRGKPVGIACSCGMGRRTTPIADTLLEKMKEVAAS